MGIGGDQRDGTPSRGREHPHHRWAEPVARRDVVARDGGA